jgi:hypothetical protein
MNRISHDNRIVSMVERRYGFASETFSNKFFESRKTQTFHVLKNIVFRAHFSEMYSTEIVKSVRLSPEILRKAPLVRSMIWDP